MLRLGGCTRGVLNPHPKSTPDMVLLVAVIRALHMGPAAWDAKCEEHSLGPRMGQG